MKLYNYIKENILIPRNIEGRQEKLRQDLIKLLSQEVIEGDLEINKLFETIEPELIKVKEVKGNVILWYYNVIPSWLKDVKIYGSFNCSQCNLTSLENCPQYVGNSFYCDENNLSSLEGCPKYIGGDIWCYQNKKVLKLPEGVKLKGRFIRV